MLRPQLEDALKRAMKAREPLRVATIRLILAALKDRDIAERGKGNGDLDDHQILLLLQTMIRQRRESIEQYERGGPHRPRRARGRGNRGDPDLPAAGDRGR